MPNASNTRSIESSARTASSVENDPWCAQLFRTSANSNTPPSGPCPRPNLPRYSLPFDPFEQPVVVLDLEVLLGGTNLSSNAEASPPGCVADGADTADCAPAYTALGLSVGTGACADETCSSQTAFRVEEALDE